MSSHAIERHFAKVPVTALSFYADHVILAGEGTNLSAYDVNTKKCLATSQVFRGQAIHGLLKDPSTKTVLIYGGNFVATARVSQDERCGLTFTVSEATNAGDWILDAAFRPSLNGQLHTHATLVTAHNSLVDCMIPSLEDSASARCVTIETLVPGSNCILYCAHISWLDASQCLVASGTAFGDIILWSYFPNADHDSSDCCQTHFTFSAHEGSVFGVQISPPNALAGHGRALVSCSDDRTVKVWAISDLNVQSPSLTEVQRHTGFGTKEGSDAQAPPLLAKAMGHISRIWAVQCVTGCSGGLRVVSFGEDATRISWDLQRAEGEDPERYDLVQVSVESLHSGKNIWATAMDGDRCATGGADGSIALMPSFAKAPHFIEFQGESLQSSPNEACGARKDGLKSYAIVDSETLVATTSSGQIVSLTLSSDGTSSVEPHGVFENIRSFSMTTGGPGYAFVAGIGGSIYLWSAQTRTITSVAEMTGKTARLFISTPFVSTEGRPDREPSLLATSVGFSIAQLYDVSPGQSNRKSTDSHNRRHWTLSLAAGSVVMSFALIHLQNKRYAALGLRNGVLSLYAVSPEPSDEAVGSIGTVDNVHGKDAITSLHWKAAGGGDHSDGYLFSTGRDGTFAVHHVISNGLPTFTLVHQLELPFGPNIEGLGFLPSGSLRVWGFKSKHFIVHDIVSQRDIMTIECGGAHRNWAFEPSEHGGTLVWTKASQVFRTTQTTLPHQSINSGGHGREIKALAVSSGKPQLIATGAEDTDIKIFTYDSESRLRCLQTLRKHVTGIQHLQFSSDNSYLFSSGGCEEFFIWRITRDIPVVGVGIVCESRHPKSGTSDLRIMGFSISARNGEAEDTSSFGISMVYSDSTLKLWSYDAGTWGLRASGDYLTACLTDVLHVPTTHDDSHACPIVTAATDGHLALWRIASDGNVEWQQRRKVHQNAILESFQHQLSDGSQLVVTAGDDNAIGFTRLSANGKVRTLLLPRAHAAAVTALTVKAVSDGRLWLLSASIDQRVKIWQINVGAAREGVEGFEVTKVANVFTSVADVSSMNLIRLDDDDNASGETGVLVCGVGMDVWRLTTTTAPQ